MPVILLSIVLSIMFDSLHNLMNVVKYLHHHHQYQHQHQLRHLHQGLHLHLQ